MGDILQVQVICDIRRFRYQRDLYSSGPILPTYFDMLIMVVKLLIERFGCRCSLLTTKPTYLRTPEF